MRHCHPEEVSSYVDGELDEAERARVEEHLRGCAACRELREGFAALHARVESFEGADTAFAGRRALGRILASGPKAPRGRLLGRTAAVPVPALVALVAALCVSVGMLAADRLGESEAPPDAPPLAAAPAPPAGGFDPSRYDGGERIAIFVERRAPEERR